MRTTTRAHPSSEWSIRGYHHPPSVYLEPSLHEEPDGLGVGAVFLREYPTGERLLRVPLPNGHGALEDDRTPVDLGRDEVHRATGDLDTVVERLLLSVQPREG